MPCDRRRGAGRRVAAGVRPRPRVPRARALPACSPPLAGAACRFLPFWCWAKKRRTDVSALVRNCGERNSNGGQLADWGGGTRHVSRIAGWRLVARNGARPPRAALDR